MTEQLVRRLAVIAYHSSPLGEPGSGDAGGMTVYVRELARALAATGISTDIFTRATTDVPRVVTLWPGVRVVSIDGGPRAPIDKGELPAFADEFADGVRAFALAQRVAYDAVHSHYWQSGLVGADLARTWAVPFVHSSHTLGRVKNSFLAPGEDPEPDVRLAGEARVIEAADVLVSSTDEEQEQLACLYRADHDSLKTIWPGVDHGLFTPGDAAAARVEAGLPLDPAVVLYVGRIQPLKGLELALRGVDGVRGALDREVLLVVVGGPSGPSGDRELARIRSLAAELGLADAVRFVGPRPQAELPAFYRAADVLAVCSHTESFGLAALEAHACGLPVVGTAVGGLSHIVRDGVSGRLIGSRDPALFAAALKEVLGDRDVARSFRREAAFASARFSWDRAAATFSELYGCLVREKLPEACTC